MSPWAALARIWGRRSNTAADILLLVGCGKGLPGCSPAQNGPTRLGIPRCELAEREGFEPSRPLRAYGISSAAPSTELGDRSTRNCANNRASPSSVDRRIAGRGTWSVVGRRTRPCDRSAIILANYTQRLARSTAARLGEAPGQSWGGGLDRATAPRSFWQ